MRFVWKKRLPSEEVVRRLERSRGNNIHPSLFKQLGREVEARIEVVGKRSKKRKAKWRSQRRTASFYNRTSSTKMLAKHTSNVPATKYDGIF